MRYDFVEAHRGRWPVRTMCRALPRSTFSGAGASSTPLSGPFPLPWAPGSRLPYDQRVLSVVGRRVAGAGRPATTTPGPATPIDCQIV